MAFQSTTLYHLIGETVWSVNLAARQTLCLISSLLQLVLTILDRLSLILFDRIYKSLEQLTVEDNQIKFWKDHLQRYFMKLLGLSYDAKIVLYLDMVGKIHTPKAGNDLLDIPLVQMNALMGLISEILIETFLELDIQNNQKFATIRAFQKLLWTQNDFISRHYVEISHD